MDDDLLDAVAAALSEYLGVSMDPRQLRPTELIRLLNSTPLGAVLTERKLHNHRAQAGFRIGSDKHVDLFRYAAWLASERHRHKPAADARAQGLSHRERMALRSRDLSNAVAEIGPIPPVANRERREACRFDLERFLVEYFPNSTGLSPFSDDHRRVIARMKRCVLEGGRFANAVYRGFAKTTLAENDAIWAVLYGHRKFVPIFGADARSAKDVIDSIKMELSENELLIGDFPEVCHAITALEGKPQRCHSQTCGGNLTHVEWTAEKVVLPTIILPVNLASELGVDVDDTGLPRNAGAILTARGITGGTRGLKHKRPDGTQQRPDFVIVDDPQTDEVAGSPHSVGKTLDVLKKAILNLGGHRKTISVVMNGTVIQPDDVVDQLLDSARNPSWQRERIPMIRKWADAHESFWLGDYARIRRTYDPDDESDQQRARTEANELYRANRAAADAGCEVSWESCFDADTELSAIQHAYNKLIDDGEEAFASECQQAPLRVVAGSADEITERWLATKLNGLQRGVVPLACDRLTAFVDVQGKLLFYAVLAFSEGFGVAVVDYGAFPDQKRSDFTLKKATRTLQHVTRGAGQEGAIYGGLKQLTEAILGRDWRREDGTLLQVTRCWIDSGWGDSTETVHTFCRQSPHAAQLCASKGFGITAAKKPMSEYERKPGETHALNAVIGPAGQGRRLARYDTNWWKSFVAARWLVPMGDHGSMTIFGREPDEHRTFFSHMVSEYRTETTGQGRKVDVWAQRPQKPDNHWWDCVVGAAAAASFDGVRLREHDAPRQKRKKYSAADIARIKAERRQGVV
jgi:hypothetical protein